ncbi:MAG: MarR family winged helix-turn-helix transcriptional regulator, partial [Dehalococcoidia bacterium]|nr:MarR family winged helix-turn-helix transcriptional regulator [Dehalococcoidia bacterium]
PTEISHVIPIETHSTSQLIDRLHKRKFVSRRRSQNDRRAVEVELTEQGLEMVVGALPNIAKVMRDVFSGLPEKEREQLVELLRKIAYAAADHLGANKEHLDENAKILSGQKRNGPGSKKVAASKSKRRTLR